MRVRVLGDIHLVRNQDDGDAPLEIQPLEQAHHFDAGPGIEVPGRLVRQKNRRVVDERTRDRDTLLLTA